MSSLSCRQGHQNSAGANFCSVCGDSLTASPSAINTPPLLPPGKVLRDRYRVCESLGEGGFGRTYLIEDTGRFDERQVLKEFSPSNKGTAVLKKAVELFRREAVTLYQLEHPQIPKFWEFFQEESRLFLVEDFVEGHTYETLLHERIRNRQAFSETEILHLLRDLLPVLSYIHSQGIIHRDISPDNIILSTKSGLPALIDLGAAKQTVINATSVESASVSHATTIGKAGYAPDEQMRMGMVAPYSDLYALAVTAIVLMTGKSPSQLFDPYSLKWNWEQHVTVNPTLAQIINRMLAPRPDQRFQSADAALEMVNALLKAPAETVVSEPNSEPNRQPNRQPNKYYTVQSAPAPSPPPTPPVASAPTEVNFAPMPSGPDPINPAPIHNENAGAINYASAGATNPASSEFINDASPENNSGCGKIFDSAIPVPDEIKGWSWGAFCLGFFWSIGNKVWIGLLTIIPYLGWVMCIVLAIKGNEWAWKSRRWASIEQFKASQRRWAIAGFIVAGLAFLISLLIGLSEA